ncbi:hypothetical protein [Ensifer adhaerens]|uniref:hypothetical protein n=1 Tax=Ensifer adhaerens TaxID=106592 RepID=UPI001C4DF695|nr:hypothetical protein [Ensifer adhaerens]MBW0370949.1 hypothetical protein [Ensifer adhaerens]UCM23919.1 hypothetical protein LDL63_29605 [Ensifer adhaerens]
MADVTPNGAKRIAYIHWGNSWQLRSFQDFNHYVDDLIYIHDLPRFDLSAYAAVIMPDAMDAAAPLPHRQQLNAYLKDGGFLVVSLQGHADWLDIPGLEWTPGNCRDWLWWTKGEQLEVSFTQPLHPITDSIPLSHMSWHWGGSYNVPEGARSILEIDGGRGSLFLDFPSLPGGGRLLLSTLDPHSHNGQRFMPATTRFLQSFYPWLNRELGIDRPLNNRFTYLQCSHVPSEWHPAWIEESLERAGFKTSFAPLYQLGPELLEKTDTLYIPSSHDEFFLKSRSDELLAFLARGGNLVICAEPCQPWLPFMAPFHAVSPRPFTNIKVRVRNDRFGIFADLGEDFDGWEGIFGQYARGWSDPPPGAIWLTDVGPEGDPKPADWIWQYPTTTGRGGYVFMHNGDNMTRYPDRGPKKEALVANVCLALRRLSMGELLI